MCFPKEKTLRILRSPDSSFSVLALCLGPTQRLVFCKRIYLPFRLLHHRKTCGLDRFPVQFNSSSSSSLSLAIKSVPLLSSSLSSCLLAFSPLFAVESASVRLYISFLYIHRYLSELIFMRLHGAQRNFSGLSWRGAG